MADESTVVSTDTNGSGAKITSFETSTTYSDAVSAYNNARVNSTGEIVGGDQLTFLERLKNFVKSNWLTMVISFAVTFVTVWLLSKPTRSSSGGGFSLWKN